MESLRLLKQLKIIVIYLNLIKLWRIWKANKSQNFLHRVWSLLSFRSTLLAPSREHQSRSCVKFGRQNFILFIQGYKYLIRHQLHLHTMILNMWRHCLAKSMLTSSQWSMKSFFFCCCELCVSLLDFYR